MYCGQMAGWIKMPLDMEIGLGQGHIVLDGDPALPQKRHSFQLSALVCCGQTAGLIKMPLDIKVVVGPGHIVLDGDPASPPKKKVRGTASPAIFGPYLLRPNGCMDQDAFGMEVGLGPGDFVLDGDRASHPQKGG